MRPSLTILAAALLCLTACTGKVPTQEELGTRHGDPSEKILLAYVFRMNDLPDATYLTHINYAFGHVNDSFDGVRLDKPEELRRLVGIRRTYPHVKILLSILTIRQRHKNPIMSSELLRIFTRAAMQTL